MRTKTLLAAAILSAGIASSMAQTSQNVVGYVNKVFTGGGRYTAVANPLNSTNDTVGGLGLKTLLPSGSKILKWNTGIVNFNIYSKITASVWSPDPAAVTVNPGEGILVFVPAASGDLTNVFLGQVMQGSLTTPVPAGFQMVSSQVPQTDRIDVLGLVPPTGSKIYKFNSLLGTAGNWAIYSKITASVWSPSQPTNSIAEGIMSYNSGAAFNWTRNFTVQ